MIVVLVLLGISASLFGCMAPTPSKPAAGKDTLALQAAAGQLEKSEECERCHAQLFNLIRTEGGKHKIECERCHVQFHVDIDLPGRAPVLPKCETCHEQVHGPDLALCSECHTEPHAPLRIPAERALEHGCYICHPEVDREIKTHVTQHTELYCHSCHHTRHRYIPRCMECHRPHTSDMTQADCLACHPAHKVLQVVYPEDIPSERCAGCHRNAYDTLEQRKSKHTAVGCAKCHPKHRMIMRCRECHPEPHTDAMTDRFRICGTCHGAAHTVTLEEGKTP